MKTFSVIYADPPWRYDNPTPGREIENHYSTMTDEEIQSLSVPAADNAVLYIWATAPRLESCMNVIKAWGFRYRTCAVWDKEVIGMGYWFRGQHELLMVATKANISPPKPELRISSVIRCRRGLHSSKPDYVRCMIEKWFPDADRLEMFTRIQRPGWDAYGNEIERDLFSNTQPEVALT